MKKVLLSVIAIALFIGLCSCSTDINSLIGKHIDDGNYSKAQEVYQDKVYGNIENENKTKEFIKSKIDKIVKDYADGSIDYYKVTGILSTIERTDLVPESISPARTKVLEIKAYKDAYTQAVEKGDRKEFAEAVNLLKSVIAEDGNYEDAQTLLKEYLLEYKKQIKSKSDKLLSDGEYQAAFLIYKKNAGYYPNDSEFNSEYSSVSSLYSKNVIRLAEQYKNDKKYTKGVKLLEDALEDMPDDKELKSKEELLNKYLPVDFTTMASEKSTFGYLECYIDQEALDNKGTSYKKAIVYQCGRGGEGYEIHLLKKKFQRFKGTVAVPEDILREKGNEKYARETGWEPIIKIYADGKLVYTSPKMYSGVSPASFDLDVTGVEKIKISYQGGGGMWYISTIIGDPVVYELYDK